MCGKIEIFLAHFKGTASNKDKEPSCSLSLFCVPDSQMRKKSQKIAGMSCYAQLSLSHVIFLRFFPHLRYKKINF